MRSPHGAHICGYYIPVFAPYWSARLATNGCFKSRALRCRENHMGPLRARTWLIGLCSVWDPIGNPHDPVRLSTSLLWSQNRRKPVSESCTSYRLYVAHTGLKIFDKSCGLARHVVGLPTGSLVFYPYGARELLGSFM